MLVRVGRYSLLLSQPELEMILLRPRGQIIFGRIMVIQRCVQLRIMQNHRSLFSDSNGNYFLSGASSGAEEQEAAQGGLVVSAEETRVHRHGAAADADASSGGDVGGATRSTSDGTDGVGPDIRASRSSRWTSSSANWAMRCARG